MTYNDLHGGQHHYVKWCSGVKYFRTHGRNLVVASVDDRKSPINRERRMSSLVVCLQGDEKQGFGAVEKRLIVKQTIFGETLFQKNSRQDAPTPQPE